MENIKEIPGTSKFIDIDTLRIYNDSKCDIDITDVVKINDEMALIEVAGVPVKKPLIWFKHLAVLGLKLPIQFKYEIVNLEFKDYKPFGVSKDYSIMPVFKEDVIFTIDNIDYKLIARYPMYGINDSGNKVYSYYSSRVISIINNDNESNLYKLYTVVDTHFKKYKKVLVHRLVAMAWCPNDDYVNKNIIDHKDDDKLNNHYTNLQWTNNKSNQAKITHGSISGNVLVRNIDTNQIKKLPSLNQASYYMGRSRINDKHTPIGKSKIWTGSNGKFEVQYESEFKYWTKNIAELKDRRITTTDENGKHYFYNLDELKLHYNLPKRLDSFKKVATRLLKLNKNVKIDIHIGSRDHKHVEAKNIITKKIVTKTTAYKLSIAIDKPRSTVEKYISKDVDNKLIGDWLVRTRTNIPWADELGTISTSKNDKQKIRATSNNESIEFVSKNKASMFFNKDMRTINSLINKGKPITLNNTTYVLEYI